MLHTLGQFATGETLTLSDDDRRRHLYIVGKTGTGKSALIRNLALSDLHSGRGFALIDPHGDLAESVADSVPKDRIADVLYIDPSETDRFFAFNPIQNVPQRQRPLVTAHVVSTFKSIWGDSWGPRMEYILTNAIRLLLDTPGTTLLGLPKLLVSESYRTCLLRKCADPVVRQFWEHEFAGYTERFQVEAVAPVQNKIGALLTDPVIRNIVGQPKSTIDISSLMNRGRVLILNLSKGKVGEAPAHLLGALISTAFAQAAEERASIPEEERRDFTLYIDEFQNFATDSFAAILSEARKYRLSLCLSHQFLSQVPQNLRSAVLGNAGTTIAFRIGAEDAPLVAPELDVKNPYTLIDTPNFQAWVRYIRDGAPAGPRVIQTFPPIETSGHSFQSVRAYSRAMHTRPRSLVDRLMERSFKETNPKRW